MKKLFLISILLILIILLSGCGIYNLNNFILPDDAEFLTLIQELDTPAKIGNYMEENFTYEFHSTYALSPYELYKLGKGDCNDFSSFGIFIANYHIYETYQIKIFYKNTIKKHWIAVYVENDDYRYSITNNQIYFQGFNTFKQIVKVDSLLFDRIWSKYNVYDYNMNIIEQGTN